MRKRHRTIYNDIYTWGWKGKRCYYCGNHAGAKDRVPPLDCVDSRGTDYFVRRNIDLVIVSSCQECNGLLGAQSIYTLDDRTQYLYERYLERYSEVLAQPTWKREEVKNLGRNLQSVVIKGDKLKADINRRLEYIEEMHVVATKKRVKIQKREDGSLRELLNTPLNKQGD